MARKPVFFELHATFQRLHIWTGGSKGATVDALVVSTGEIMRINSLTQAKATKLVAGKHSDGRGLWLHKRNQSCGKWVFRYISWNRRREMGLGRWPDVSIEDARAAAADARRLLQLEKDPINERAKRSSLSRNLTIAAVVSDCFEALKPNLKDDGRAGRWLSPLQNHVLPKLGETPIELLDQHEIVSVFGPIWREKPEAARKAMNRLNLALKYASAVGADVDLHAPSKAKTLLGPQRQKVKHIPAMAYQDIPAYYRELKMRNEVSALALRFLILTAARTSEVRFISSKEIHSNVWSLPGDRTKSGRAFRIPLTHSARCVLNEARALSPNDYFFISIRGKPMSDMAMSKLMKRQGLVARPHGFRAAFRTWAEEQTDFAFEVKESALAHNVDRGVVAAYQRSDRFEKRRQLLESWENFLLHRNTANS